MSTIDSRIVRRSHQLFREAQVPVVAEAAAAEAAEGESAAGETAGGEAGRRGYGPHFGFRERALARDEAVARGLAAPMAEVRWLQSSCLTLTNPTQSCRLASGLTLTLTLPSTLALTSTPALPP